MNEGIHHSRRGIALLEVLIALTVMGLGVTAALKAIGTCTRSESKASKDAVVQRLAEQQLALLRSQRAQLTSGEHRGRFDAPQDGYSWSAAIEPPVGDDSFFLVRLSIFSEQAPRYPVLVTQSLL